MNLVCKGDIFLEKIMTGVFFLLLVMSLRLFLSKNNHIHQNKVKLHLLEKLISIKRRSGGS